MTRSHRRGARLLRRLGLLSLATAAFATGVVAPTVRSADPRAHLLALQHLAAAAGAGFDAVAPMHGAEMAGVTFRLAPGAAAPSFEIRGLVGGAWTDWVRLDADPDEGPDGAATDGAMSTQPAWLGHDAEQAELRVLSGEVTDVALRPVNTDPTPPAGSALGLPVAGASPVIGDLPFITDRAAWHADEADSWSSDLGCQDAPDIAAGGITGAVLHHTVNSNDYGPGDSAALVRGIQAYHVFNNGWCDIGYNFLVDRFGQIFEGRRSSIFYAAIGAHAGGFNTGSTGVALIGDHTATAVSPAAYSSLVTLLSWKLAYHGTPAVGTYAYTAGDFAAARWPAGTVVDINRISGHRDVDVTGCPGDFAYALLDQLRADVAARLAAVPSDQRMLCDWDGDGVDTPGVFRDGQWWIRNDNSAGPFPTVFRYGDPGDIALCGRWSLTQAGDTPAIYRNGSLYIRRSLSSGVADQVIAFGQPGDRAVAGDWNGDGVDTLAVFHDGTWQVTDTYVPGLTTTFRFGDPGDRPIAGDWTGTGHDSIGVWRAGRWYERDTFTTGVADRSFAYGNSFNDEPVVGHVRPPDAPPPSTTTTTTTTPASTTTTSTTSTTSTSTSTTTSTTSTTSTSTTSSSSSLPVPPGPQPTGVGITRGAYWFLADTPGGPATNVFPA